MKDVTKVAFRSGLSNLGQALVLRGSPGERCSDLGPLLITFWLTQSPKLVAAVNDATLVVEESPQSNYSYYSYSVESRTCRTSKSELRDMRAAPAHEMQTTRQAPPTPTRLSDTRVHQVVLGPPLFSRASRRSTEQRPPVLGGAHDPQGQDVRGQGRDGSGEELSTPFQVADPSVLNVQYCTDMNRS